MGERYPKYSPRNKWKPSAPLVNNLSALVEDNEASRSGQGIGLRGPRVNIKNTSGDTLSEFSVVGIADPITTPVQDENEYLSDISFDSAEPAQGATFAILQDGLLRNNIGEAVISGETHARIYINDITHGYADAEDANYAYLHSQAAGGQARIIYANIPDDTQLNGGINNSVTTIVVDAESGWPDPSDADCEPFVVLIESEKILVTAVSGTSWTVERAYDGTAAAAHADNTAVAFVEGVVLAKVLLFGVVIPKKTEVIELSHGIKSNSYFDAKLQSRDNVTPEWDDGADAIWALHLIDTPALVTGDRYGAVEAGSELGGAWVAIAASTGAALTDTSKWIQLRGTTTPTVWSATTTYIIGNLVSSGGNNYICILGHTNQTPPNATYWVQVTLSAQGEYNAATSYTAGQWVKVRRAIYVMFDPPDATESHRGVVNTITQRFEGDKYFNAQVISDTAFCTSFGGAVPPSPDPSVAIGAVLFNQDDPGTLSLLKYDDNWDTATGFYVTAWTGSGLNGPKLVLTGAWRDGTLVSTEMLTRFGVTAYEGAGPLTEYYGAYATVSGMVFKGGLYISGSISIGFGSITGTLQLATQVTGTLAVGNGGSGGTTFTANGILLGNAASPFAVTAAMTNGQLLVGQTDAAPSPATMSGDATLAADGTLTIASNAITTGKIADDAVTYAKMQDVSAESKLLGRGQGGGSGNVQEISVGTGLSMSGTTLSCTAGTLAGGGTGSDLSGTGPGIVIQATGGAVLTVQQEANIAALTDSSGGTANDTVAAVSGTGDDATINDNFADVAAKINAILALLQALKAMA